MTIEILKSNYNIENSNPDDNIRFILVNVIPFYWGVYATKLKVEINCKTLQKKKILN